ncbi:MAG: NTP transferase domain-containing protein [Myxococcota bacterium]
MRGFVIAAGMGKRMRRLTASTPKCMLEVGGRPLLHHTMECLREIGCDEIAIIGGYAAARLDPQGAKVVLNDDFENNNILHSLMYARAELEGPAVVTYSDIWVEPEIFAQLGRTPGDIVLSVDHDWEAYYEARSDHPVSQAENVFYDDGGAKKIGKHLVPADAPPLSCGEFLGLWRMSAEGTRAFAETFAKVDDRLAPEAPFQHAAQWRKAYITDIFEEMIDDGQRLDLSLHARGWAELDTEQDIERLPGIAKRQRLDTLMARTANSGAGQ